MTTFTSLNIHDDFVQILKANEITMPTPIQIRSIPKILEGKDIVAESQTGTGKTLAYLLPVLQKIDTNLKGLQAVVIVPTHELAMQILREVEKLNVRGTFVAQALIGGAAIHRQIERLRLHPHIVVGTPGRIVELIQMRKLKMHQVRTIVVDEVDQVWNLGSMDDVEKVLRSALRDRQIVFFSATIPDSIQQVANRWMNEPTQITIDPSVRISEHVEHVYFICEPRQKVDTLRRILRLFNPKLAIVFINEMDRIAELTAKLKYMGFHAEAIYGEANKRERALAINRFREGRVQILIATDVAARGLDIDDVTHVIHFDLPIDVNHYVHRVGRTGRMGRRGTAISIITAKERFIVEKFAKNLNIPIFHKEMYRGQVTEPRQKRIQHTGRNFRRKK